VFVQQFADAIGEKLPQGGYSFISPKTGTALILAGASVATSLTTMFWNSLTRDVQMRFGLTAAFTAFATLAKVITAFDNFRRIMPHYGTNNENSARLARLAMLAAEKEAKQVVLDMETILLGHTPP
jgi:hypothetical protein